MATSVSQKVQSRFEPWLAEPGGITSRCTPRDHKTLQNPMRSSSNCAGWSFLQALSNITSSDPNSIEKHEKAYVHPLVKRSKSMLSEKSLEMCTENLGSETGSNISENGDELTSCLVSDTTRSKKMLCFEPRRRWGCGGSSFPPPLTTISGGGLLGGGGGVRVESERGDGRLVLKAVSVEANLRCFKAERRDGRLRLHLLTPFSTSCSSLERYVNDDGACMTSDDDDDGYDGDGDDHDGDNHNYKDDDGDDEDGEDGIHEGIVENSVNVGCGIEVGNFRRPMGCKENGIRSKDMINWEAILVATT